MKLAIITTGYDYFDYDGKYHKPQTTVIEGALNAWNFYKSEKSKDYNYGDSYRETHIYRFPNAYGYVKPPHKIHGQRFGHKPTVEEKLRRAVDDALDAWREANETYRATFDKYGYWHPKTNEARIKAEDLWEKIEEAETERDEYLHPYDIDEDFDFEDDDLLF